MQALRTELANWADGKKSAVGELEDLRTETGVELLGQVLEEANGYAQPATADLVEVLHEKVKELHGRATAVPVLSQLDKVIDGELPVFIYFENYGILDSAVYLPRFWKTVQQIRRIRVFGRSMPCSNMGSWTPRR